MTRARIYRAGLFALGVLTIGLYALFAALGAFVSWDVSYLWFSEWAPVPRLLFALAWLFVAYLVWVTVQQKIDSIKPPAGREVVE